MGLRLLVGPGRCDELRSFFVEDAGFSRDSAAIQWRSLQMKFFLPRHPIPYLQARLRKS